MFLSTLSVLLHETELEKYSRVRSLLKNKECDVLEHMCVKWSGWGDHHNAWTNIEGIVELCQRAGSFPTLHGEKTLVIS